MQISALILAGGRSSRMAGEDKGLIPLLGQPMIKYVIERLKPQIDTIFISANRHLEQYQAFGFPVLVDNYDDYRGPLAGMARGLARTKSEYLLTVPCDGPLLPLDIVARMRDEAQKQSIKALVAFDGQFRQPTYNLIHRSLLSDLEYSLENNEHKLGKWLMDHQAKTIDFSDQSDAFTNINKPEDLNRLSIKLSEVSS